MTTPVTSTLVRDATIRADMVRLPSVEACTIPDSPAATNAMQNVAQILNTRFGNRAPLAERAVTWGELFRRGFAGLLDENGNVIRHPTPPGGVVPLPPVPLPNDPTNDPIPPAPTGLTATGALATIILDWDDHGLDYIAETEIWRNDTDNLSTAVRIGATPALVYADPVGLTGVTYYYWIRFLNRKDEPGPYNDADGTSAQTGRVGGTDLTDAIITAAKIASGAINFNVIAGQILGGQIGSGTVGSTHLTAELDARIANAGSGDTTPPGAPTSLAATGGIQTIVVSWINPGDGDLAGVEIHRSATNDRASATLRGESRSTVFVDPVSSGSSFYYWVRAVDTSGNVGSFNAGTGATGVLGTTGQITTPDIGDGTITDIKVLNLSAAKITTGTLDANRIGAASITADKLAAASVVAGKIQAGALVAGDGVISNAYITAAMIQTAAIGSAAIQNAAVTNAAIANAAIDTAKIADAAVVTAKIGDAAISTAKIGDAQVTNAKIVDLNATKITAGFLNAARIQAGTISADKIEVGIVGGANLASNTAFLQSTPVTFSGGVGSRPLGWGMYNNTSVSAKLDVLAGGPFNTNFVRVTWFATINTASTDTMGIFTSLGQSGADAIGGVREWTAGQPYVISLWARAAPGSSAIGATLAPFNANHGWSETTILVNPGLTTAFQRYVFVVVPSGAGAITSGQWFLSLAGATYAAGSYEVGAVKIEPGRMVTAWQPSGNGPGEIVGTRIADGTISTNHLAANSITADKVQAGAIGASKIAVGELSAISADLGVVTAGLLQNITGSTLINMDATFTDMFLRAGVPQDYGYLHGTHSPIEIIANGQGFFGREVISAARPKANGTFNIQAANKPRATFNADGSSPPIGPGGLEVGSFFIDTGFEDPLGWTVTAQAAELYAARVYYSAGTHSPTVGASNLVGQFHIDAVPVWSVNSYQPPTALLPNVQRVYLRVTVYATLVNGTIMNAGGFIQVDQVNWSLYRI